MDLGNFYGTLRKGNPPAGIELNVPAGIANGLKKPMKAEVHLVVRTHGEPIAGEGVYVLCHFWIPHAPLELEARGILY